jgi:hypothetical protein
MPRCAEAGCGRWRLFGALQFNGSSYCSRECVEQAALIGLGEPAATTASRTSLPPLKLGALLRHAGVITATQLEAALIVKARTGLRIGEQLEQLGLVDADVVLRALATQANVSYLSTFDVARVRRAPVSLPSAMVRALGLVPFEADEIGQRLHVISAAPLPRAAIRAMARLTERTIDVYLVKDSVFGAALDAYRPADGAPVTHEADLVRTLTAAAARVADRAQSDRAITMRHATYDDYVWVRVEGSQRVSDLLVGKETGCQAELTAH